MGNSVAGYVPLPAIVKKVVSDHAGSSLGEFRHVILAMLDTYSYDTAIHRTAASLLFESLRTVVRERHTLKGAGVRVSAVGGFDLHPPRIAAAAATANAAGSPPEARGVFSVGGGGGGGRSLAPHPPVPSGLLGAVGSGVISVSSGGVAVVEHLGRGGAGGGEAGSRNTDEGDVGGDDDDGSGTGARRAASPPPPAVAMPQQDASASLWRLRAARRRRQARGDKMRSLARWSAGEDTGPVRGDGGDRARGAIGQIPVMNRGGSKVLGRNGGGGGGGGGALGGDENGRVLQRGGGPGAAAAAGGAAANQYRGEGEEEQSRGRQALGWGSALQARAALALPASFLTKRT
ncbi:unnamed protein product [Ectocarpus fasciculatus]